MLVASRSSIMIGFHLELGRSSIVLSEAHGLSQPFVLMFASLHSTRRDDRYHQAEKEPSN